MNNMDELLIHNVTSKLESESKDVAGREASVMKNAVKDALLEFSKQSSEFAQAILESDKSFKDCMNAVAKDVRNSISDIEAYRRAVQFYFPGADIKFNMTINLSASVEKDTAPISVSLLDLL